MTATGASGLPPGLRASAVPYMPAVIGPGRMYYDMRTDELITKRQYDKERRFLQSGQTVSNERYAKAQRQAGKASPMSKYTTALDKFFKRNPQFANKNQARQSAEFKAFYKAVKEVKQEGSISQNLANQLYSYGLLDEFWDHFAEDFGS